MSDWTLVSERMPTDPGRYEIKWRPQTNTREQLKDRSVTPTYGREHILEVTSVMRTRVNGEPVWIWDDERDIPAVFYRVDAWRRIA
jgi:hypothetical protein